MLLAAVATVMMLSACKGSNHNDEPANPNALTYEQAMQTIQGVWDVGGDFIYTISPELIAVYPIEKNWSWANSTDFTVVAKSGKDYSQGSFQYANPYRDMQYTPLFNYSDLTEESMTVAYEKDGYIQSDSEVSDFQTAKAQHIFVPTKARHAWFLLARQWVAAIDSERFDSVAISMNYQTNTPDWIHTLYAVHIRRDLDHPQAGTWKKLYANNYPGYSLVVTPNGGMPESGTFMNTESNNRTGIEAYLQSYRDLNYYTESVELYLSMKELPRGWRQFKIRSHNVIPIAQLDLYKED